MAGGGQLMKRYSVVKLDWPVVMMQQSAVMLWDVKIWTKHSAVMMKPQRPDVMLKHSVEMM